MAVVMPKTIVIAPVQSKRPISGRFSLNMASLTDSEDSVFECSPRKRKRLTHLTPEERLMRRKLKNRVAAQTARDRKRMRMQELEETVAALEAENQRLQLENAALKKRTGGLSEENTLLKERFGLDGVDCAGVQTERCEPAGSAAPNPPLPQEKAHILRPVTSQFPVYFLLTAMILTLLDYYNKSSRAEHRMKLTRRQSPAAAMPAQKAIHHLEWWGPQQRSWNPSKN